MSRRRDCGFTLVVVALVLVAVAMTTESLAVQRNAQNLKRVEDKLLAHWLALNAVNSALLTAPDEESTEQVATMLGQEFIVYIAHKAAAGEIPLDEIRVDAPAELPEGQTLFAIINRTAKEAAIASSIKRINPQGKLAATIVAKDVEFNKFARWLVNIYQTYGIEATEFSVNASSDAGLVNATFELTVAQ